MIFLKELDNIGKEFVKNVHDRIKSLTYTDTDDGMDEFKLVLENKDLYLWKDTTLIDNKSIVAQWGEVNNVTRPREIIFVRIEGFENVTITGHCKKLWEGDTEVKNRLFKNKNYYDMIMIISRELGYQFPDIDSDLDVELNDRQQKTTNSRFLAQLARDLGCKFWIGPDNLHFKRRKFDKRPKLILTFQGLSNNDDFGKILGYPRFEFAYTRAKPKVRNTKNKKEKIICIPAEVYEREKAKQEEQEALEEAMTPEEKAARAEAQAQAEAEAERSEAQSEEPSTTTSGDIAKKILKTKSSVEHIIYAKSDSFDLQVSSKKIEEKAVTGEKKKAPSTHKDEVYKPKGKPKKQRKGYGPWKLTDDTKFNCIVTIHGDYRLLTGDLVFLSNVGKIFEGKWYIRKIVHRINEKQFTQTLHLNRNSLPEGKDKVDGKVNQCKPGEVAVPASWQEFLVDSKGKKTSMTDEAKARYEKSKAIVKKIEGKYKLSVTAGKNYAKLRKEID